nr:EF-Tu/IF-2/RF-3 family GTPase [uncultured Acetatifactor sp.]
MGLFSFFKKSKPLDGTYQRDMSRSEDSYYGNAAYGAAEAFRIVVEDIFSITGRGTVITGKVEAGSIVVGDTVMLRRRDGSGREVTITGIEMFRRVLNSAKKGDNVGLLLRGVDRAEVSRGDILEQCD